jgi:hypothetical protein
MFMDMEVVEASAAELQATPPVVVPVVVDLVLGLLEKSVGIHA